MIQASSFFLKCSQMLSAAVKDVGTLPASYTRAHRNRDGQAVVNTLITRLTLSNAIVKDHRYTTNVQSIDLLCVTIGLPEAHRLCDENFPVQNVLSRLEHIGAIAVARPKVRKIVVAQYSALKTAFAHYMRDREKYNISRIVLVQIVLDKKGQDPHDDCVETITFLRSELQEGTSAPVLCAPNLSGEIQRLGLDNRGAEEGDSELEDIVRMYQTASAQDRAKLMHKLKHPDRYVKECGFCHRKGITFKFCSRCRRVYYCSSQCQTQHWRAEHKAACTRVYQIRTVLILRPFF